jgi:hypothetical protein
MSSKLSSVSFSKASGQAPRQAWLRQGQAKPGVSDPLTQPCLPICWHRVADARVIAIATLRAHSGRSPLPLLLPSSLHSWSEADGRARKTSTSHYLLSAGMWPALSRMRVTLELSPGTCPISRIGCVYNPGLLRACPLRTTASVSCHAKSCCLGVAAQVVLSCAPTGITPSLR